MFFLHVSLVPYIGPSGELKTKPTQHSVAALRQVGIQPDAVVCRADREIPDSVKRKISLMCDVDEQAVVAAIDAPSIYDIPKVLHSEGLDAYVVRRLDLRFRDVDWTQWNDLLDRVHHPKEEVTIALVGKYIDLPDAYLSVSEALRAGGFANQAKVIIRWVPSDELRDRRGCRPGCCGDVDGVVIPGGFGIRGVEGKVGAVRYARENQIPILGLCLGLQCMVIEVARHLAGLDGADSSEFSPDTPHQVIATMAEQVAIVDGGGDLGGSMRLGSYPAELLPGSVVAKRYGQARGRRSGTGTATRSTTPTATGWRRPGLVISGTSPDSKLVEFIELPDEVHPYFVATQAHPELKSRPTRPHPLFVGLVEAALDRRLATRLPVDDRRSMSADDRHLRAAELADDADVLAGRCGPRVLADGANRSTSSQDRDPHAGRAS